MPEDKKPVSSDDKKTEPRDRNRDEVDPQDLDSVTGGGIQPYGGTEGGSATSEG